MKNLTPWQIISGVLVVLSFVGGYSGLLMHVQDVEEQLSADITRIEHDIERLEDTVYRQGNE